MNKGRIISLVGNNKVGKTEAIVKILNKRLNCYNQRVLYLGRINPFSKYDMSNRNLSVSIHDEISNHSNLIDLEIAKHLRENDAFHTVVLDFSSSQRSLTREDVVKLRYYANEFNVDIIISLQDSKNNTLIKQDNNSYIYNFSDIVVYPNKGVSGRIDIPEESLINIDRFINML